MHLPAVLLAAVLPLLVSACAPVTPNVSLLFQNDGNWTTFEQRPSALLFHDELTYPEALRMCQTYDESLLDCASVPSLTHQFTYLEYLSNHSGGNSAYWVAGKQTITSSQPFCQNSIFDSAQRTFVAGVKRHKFLCTNSAPHTKQVGTNFSQSPRITVESKGTVYTGTRDHLTFRFTGVPYAKAPLGDLRFAHAEPWTGKEVDATELKSPCLQTGPFGDNDLGLNPWGNSEDCLYLNIYTPYIPGQKKSAIALKPVMFWLHGGGNTQGTGSDATFDGGSLSSRSDVVVVTINYRLGAFGYLALDKETLPGNYALSDKIAALQWVQDNAAAFGGDPKRVGIFGQSAGGWSVGELLTSPKARNLFSSAIAQSGLITSMAAIDVTRFLTLPLLEPLCDGSATAACLRALPADVLLKATADNAYAWAYSVVDDFWLEKAPIEQVALGAAHVNSVPLMTGFLPDEGQSFLTLMNPSATPEMTDFDGTLASTLGPKFAKAVSDSGLWVPDDSFTVYNATVNALGLASLSCPIETFVNAAKESGAFPALHFYSLNRAYGMPWFNPFGLCTFPVGPDVPYYRCHSGDLYEIFGTYYFFSQIPRSNIDIYHTNLMQDLWASFARTQNPIPEKAYLEARGYESTLQVLKQLDWTWPDLNVDERVVDLDWAALGKREGLPEKERCEALSKIRFGF